MLTGNKYKKNLETQDIGFIFIPNKNPYIMILLIAQYLLVGTIVSFLLEHTIRSAQMDVTFGERLWMITLWPVMVVVFVYNFIKGLLGRD